MAHPDKGIRKAIEFAVGNGWSYEEGGKSHKKGILRCPGNSPECRYFVYGTPRNPGNVAKSIRRNVNHCTIANTELSERKQIMQTYCFTAILKDYSECSEEMADALFEAGIDDALIGSSYHRVTIDFGRDAESFTAAVQSANRDIRKAGFQIDRVHAS